MTDHVGGPMMDLQEVGMITDILKNRLRCKAKALEFGCGGSTITFSQYAKSWVSIEHNEDWFKKISSAVLSSDSVSLLYRPPEYPHSGFEPAKPDQFTRYISAATEKCPDGGFDFVLVDGRARITCMIELHEQGLLNRQGIVVLHDFRRTRYLLRLGEVLRFYDLTAALTEPPLRGLGVFEYRADTESKMAAPSFQD